MPVVRTAAEPSASPAGHTENCRELGSVRGECEGKKTMLKLQSSFGHMTPLFITLWRQKGDKEKKRDNLNSFFFE